MAAKTVESPHEDVRVPRTHLIDILAIHCDEDTVRKILVDHPSTTQLELLCATQDEVIVGILQRDTSGFPVWSVQYRQQMEDLIKAGNQQASLKRALSMREHLDKQAGRIQGGRVYWTASNLDKMYSVTARTGYWQLPRDWTLDDDAVTPTVSSILSAFCKSVAREALAKQAKGEQESGPGGSTGTRPQKRSGPTKAGETEMTVKKTAGKNPKAPSTTSVQNVSSGKRPDTKKTNVTINTAAGKGDAHPVPSRTGYGVPFSKRKRVETDEEPTKNNAVGKKSKVLATPKPITKTTSKRPGPTRGKARPQTKASTTTAAGKKQPAEAEMELLADLVDEGFAKAKEALKEFKVMELMKEFNSLNVKAGRKMKTMDGFHAILSTLAAKNAAKA